MDSVLDRANCCRRLRKALKCLPSKYRQALVDHFVRGYSVKQVARLRRIPLGTVLSRIFNGKKLLRRAWALDLDKRKDNDMDTNRHDWLDLAGVQILAEERWRIVDEGDGGWCGLFPRNDPERWRELAAFDTEPEAVDFLKAFKRLSWYSRFSPSRSLRSNRRAHLRGSLLLTALNPRESALNAGETLGIPVVCGY